MFKKFITLRRAKHEAVKKEKEKETRLEEKRAKDRAFRADLQCLQKMASHLLKELISKHGSFVSYL